MQRSFIRLAVLAAIALMLTRETTAQSTKFPAAPEGVVIERGVAYLPERRAEKADLYLPARREAAVRSPAVVIIHGGGWTGGKRDAAREFNIGTNLRCMAMSA